MDFYLADGLTTFLTIALFAVIFFVFSKRGLRERFFTLWTLGWGLLLLQYLAQVAVINGLGNIQFALLLDEILLAAAAIMFCLSARTFVGLRTPRAPVVGLGLLFALLSYWQAYHSASATPDVTRSNTPGYFWKVLVFYHFSVFSLLIGLVFLYTGWVFFRSRERPHSIGVQTLIFGFAAGGIGLMSFGIVLRWEYLTPLLLQFLDLPRFFAAVGMFVYLFEREKVGVQKHRDDAVKHREFVQSLVDNANDSIFVTDQEGKFQWANKKCEEGLGLSSEELKGRSYREFIRGKDRFLVEQAATAVFQGKPQSLEIQMEAPQENYRTLQISMSPVYDAESHVTGVLTVGRNVTEMKTMERQLQHAEKLMALGQMISGAAHELNNPLTTVMGFSELSLQDKALDPKLRQRFDRILQAAARSKKIVESLQSFVRVPEHAVESIELNDLVVESLSPFEKDFQDCHINTKLRFGHDPMWVNVNRDRLVQVIQSILKNAMEAIRDVKDGGTIAISTGIDGDNTFVSISDDGPGV